MFEKPVRKKNRKYLDWVSKQLCVICKSPGQYHDSGEWLNDPCHILGKGAGGGDEGNVFPACRKHHSEQHKIGINAFQVKYGLDLRKLAKRYWQNYLKI